MTYRGYWSEVGLAGSEVTGSGAAGATVALPPRILNITVPQVGHLPLMALRPFFMISSTASMISFLALHLTQYPSGIKNVAAPVLHAPQQSLQIAYGEAVPTVNIEKLKLAFDPPDPSAPTDLNSLRANNLRNEAEFGPIAWDRTSKIAFPISLRPAEGLRAYSATGSCRNAVLSTLPVALRGRAGSKRICRGTL